VPRRRLDVELVRRGLAASPTEARQAIEDGRVTVGGRPTSKPATLVSSEESLALEKPARRFASRGGIKLEAALEGFAIAVRGRRCLDAGAGTGGFTDVLLSRGAAAVIAVDVGYGQLDWRLRGDPRVTVLERVNVRNLDTTALPFAPEIVVADLAFISLSKVLPALAAVAAPGATFVLLVKPQFEAGREEVGPSGVVSDPAVWRRVIERVVGDCRRLGLGPSGVMASPVRGPAGNVEFLVHARQGADPVPLDVEAALAQAPSSRRKTG
jgi:23S rRNA (cytidine1920-2'-O)/16S rRNA (cytidine1409-2'-O)-methyltransferase